MLGKVFPRDAVAPVGMSTTGGGIYNSSALISTLFIPLFDVSVSELVHSQMRYSYEIVCPVSFLHSPTCVFDCHAFFCISILSVGSELL